MLVDKQDGVDVAVVVDTDGCYGNDCMLMIIVLVKRIKVKAMMM